MNTLILTYNKYPDGDAGALRQHTFAKLLGCMCDSIFVIGMGESTGFQKRYYEGVEYISFRYSKNNFVAKVKNVLGFRRNLHSFLKNCNIQFDIILVVDIPLPVLFYIKKYAEKNDISLLHDSVEWYSPEQFRYGKFSRAYILKELYNRKLIDKQFKVIAISKFLMHYFNSKECETVRIPVIMDIKNAAFKKRTHPYKLTLMYAGSPGTKDYLSELIKGLSLLSQWEIQELELRVVGVTKDQLISKCNVNQKLITSLGKSLNIIGRIPRSEVLYNLEECDFTVLLRSPTQRYAKAGFPTKIVESLASATPVICNITSDLGDYITDMVNGIVVVACTPEAFASSVRRALQMSPEELVKMRKRARQTAEDNFDYRLYLDTVRNLVIDL